MPWKNPSPSPLCPACCLSVFPAEAYMASDRRPFHKTCVKCQHCKKRLNPGTINEHEGELYCQSCYTIIFMPQDDQIPERTAMQVLPVGGTYMAIEMERRRLEDEKRRREEEERAKKEGGCPGCCKKVFGEDCVNLGSGITYHKACLACSSCNKPAASGVPMMLGPRNPDNVFGEEELDPFCNTCFAKKFKMSAFNIAETVQIVPETIGL